MQNDNGSAYALELRHVNHHYGKKQILFDMNLKLPSGRIYGLLGRNGAGKTTLINLISAQIFQSVPARGERAPGEALIFGHKAHEHVDTLKKLCVVREKSNMPDSLRVCEALATAASLYPNWDAEYARHLVERFALDTKKRYRSLSRGMESALGLVIGLTIFDEPSLGLDAAAREYFYEELIRDFEVHPRTVIISTHMIDEVASLFEDVVIVDKGRVKLHMPLDELLSSAVTVAGPRAEVERQTEGMTVLHEEVLGSDLAARALISEDDEQTPLSPDEFNAQRARAVSKATGMCMRSVWLPEGHEFESGVELYPVPLQKLFVYLTEGGSAQ